RPRAADEQQQVVDDEGDGQHVDGIAPGEDLEEAQEGQAASPCCAIACQTSRSCTVSATSWTRTMAAPSAAAQAAAARLPPSRRSGTARSPPDLCAALAMKLLRLAPTRRGRPSAASS